MLTTAGIPGLVKVRNSNTGARADAGPQMEFVLDKVNTALKRLSVRGYRHYHNFDEWMRRMLLETVEAELLAPSSRVQAFVTRTALLQMIRESRDGVADRSYLLQIPSSSSSSGSARTASRTRCDALVWHDRASGLNRVSWSPPDIKEPITVGIRSPPESSSPPARFASRRRAATRRAGTDSVTPINGPRWIDSLGSGDSWPTPTRVRRSATSLRVERRFERGGWRARSPGAREETFRCSGQSHVRLYRRRAFPFSSVSVDESAAADPTRSGFRIEHDGDASTSA
jgi:hypothetical protein